MEKRMTSTYSPDQLSPTSGRPHDVLEINSLSTCFNEDEGAVRLLLLLSPTCSLCLQGASEIEDTVLKKVSEDDVRVYAVWLPILKTDTAERVAQAMRRLSDSRVLHFWDGRAEFADKYSRVLRLEADLQGWTMGSIFSRLVAAYNCSLQYRGPSPAWDVYLLFGRTAQWEGEPPAPDFWMHQLKLLKLNRLNGPKFAGEVKRLLRQPAAKTTND
jgi:hypothetical protein